MKQVFISYSTKDFAQAQAVRNVLEQNGISCWMAPADIPGGSNYTKEIPIAIRGCQAFVLMLSDNAQKSHWVLKELDRAVNEGKIILPFQLEDVPLSDEFNFLLTGAQRYDAYKKKTEALKRLVLRIKAIVESGPDVPDEDELVIVDTEPEIRKRTQTIAGDVICPACGSTDATMLPFAVKPQNFLEGLAYYGMPILVAAVLPWFVLVGGLLILLLLDMTDLGPAIITVMLLSLASVIAGGIWGAKMAKEWLRRRHLRNHSVTQGYQCRQCSKKFEVVTND